MKALVIVVAAVTGGCSFEADYTGTVYQCGAHDECPYQYTCVAGYCMPDDAAGTTCSTDVAAGDEHTCVVRTDGSVWCWGRNDRGQIGDNMTTDADLPTMVAGLVGVTATSVVAGAVHTCALASDGTVWCWGSNQHGQLGDGTMADSRTAVQVKNLTGVAAIAAGDHHTCALVAGAVQCWGGDEHHQLGDATTMDRVMPAPVAGLGSVTAIAAGHNTSCAIGSDTHLYCWGDNANGQLGDGTMTTRGNPMPVPLTGAVSVSVASFSVTVVLDNGLVYSFGDNGNGELGDATENSSSSPVHTTIASQVTTSFAAGQHACVLDAAQHVWCWGVDYDGELFDHASTLRFAALRTPLEGVTKMALGMEHSCALTSKGNVTCVGWNGRGQLGDGLQTSQSAPTLPVAMTVSDLVDVSAGGANTCVLHADHTSTCWGENGAGQLGDGTQVNRGTPAPLLGLSNIAKIDHGPDENCALDTAGSVWCWGANDNGKLGDNGYAYASVPVKINLPPATDIAVGNAHVCAALGAAGAMCWGYEGPGELGINGNYDARATPTQVMMLPNAEQIVAGNTHTCALTSAGSVSCWGGGAAVGNGGMPALVPVAIAGMTGVTKLVAHGNFTCALKSDNTLWCWGANDAGQLGDGTTTNSATPKMVQSGVAQVSAGSGHACMIKTDNSVWCWGENGEGQIGNGSYTNATMAQAIPVPGTPTSIAAGASHTCVISGANLYCWGGDIFGELGDGVVDWLTPRGVNVPCP